MGVFLFFILLEPVYGLQMSFIPRSESEKDVETERQHQPMMRSQELESANQEQEKSAVVVDEKGGIHTESAKEKLSDSAMQSSMKKGTTKKELSDSLKESASNSERNLKDTSVHNPNGFTKQAHGVSSLHRSTNIHEHNPGSQYLPTTHLSDVPGEVTQHPVFALKESKDDPTEKTKVALVEEGAELTMSEGVSGSYKTKDGYTCRDGKPCEKNGETYFWCKTKEHVWDRADTWDKCYAGLGSVRHGVVCFGGADTLELRDTLCEGYPKWKCAKKGEDYRKFGCTDLHCCDLDPDHGKETTTTPKKTKTKQCKSEMCKEGQVFRCGQDEKGNIETCRQKCCKEKTQCRDKMCTQMPKLFFNCTNDEKKDNEEDCKAFCCKGVECESSMCADEADKTVFSCKKGNASKATKDDCVTDCCSECVEDSTCTDSSNTCNKKDNTCVCGDEEDSEKCTGKTPICKNNKCVGSGATTITVSFVLAILLVF